LVAHSHSEFEPAELFPAEAGLSETTEEGGVMIGFEGVCVEFRPGGVSRSFAATPKEEPSHEWMLPRLSDYWDFNIHALQRGADRYEALPESEWDAAGAQIAAALTEHFRAFPDNLLRGGAVSFVDDLYKEASATTRWGGAFPRFMYDCAGTISRLFAERGIHIQYLVDNEFEDMTRPLQLYSDWFRHAGFVYLCPQATVLDIAAHDGVAESAEFAELCRRYIAEARHIVDQAAERCQAERKHFIHLDTDSVPTSYNVALHAIREPGTVTVSRDHAPVPGSKVDVWIADEMDA